MSIKKALLASGLALVMLYAVYSFALADESARQAFIEDIIGSAKGYYNRAGNQPQRAHYSGDKYICKNFTITVFKDNAKKYRLASYPDVPLKVPENLPKEDCAPYTYGICWKFGPASEGNPFVLVDQFLYNENLSPEENREFARSLMMRVRRGDYFQMSANYRHGVGAHSLIFISDYDPGTDSVHWTDSNMLGTSKSKIRYGYVQFDASEDIDWFVDAFCQKKRGATLYRLSTDIEPVPVAE